jgi:hypothetical protein
MNTPRHKAVYDRCKQTEDTIFSDFAAMSSLAVRLEHELVAMQRSFDGHVYVPNEEYAALCELISLLRPRRRTRNRQ